MTSLEYRPAIDGLRAIAVLAVIGNHYGIPGFDGGFLGVDIFFCISGYLITSIILDEISTNAFSFATFISRRIRRLFPALFVMLMAVLTASIMLHGPHKSILVGAGVASAALYYSNIHFYWNVDYFSEPADAEPVLHTWSLAVEEQFYLVWPLLLLITFRLASPGPDWRNTAIVGTAVLVASFLASWTLSSAGDPQAFYLLHARAWELACGALLAILHARGASTFARFARHDLARDALLTGGLCVIAACVLLSEATAGIWSSNAPVVAGTLMILATQDRPSATRISPSLTNSLSRFLGKTSYSLYLWHWPIYVFILLLYGPKPSAAILALALLVVTATATVSWLFVERPFRRLQSGSVVTIATGLAASLVVFAMSLGTGAIRSAFLGAEETIASISEYAEQRNPKSGECMLTRNHPEIRSLGRCRIGSWAAAETPADADFVILGDSHADHWAPGMDTSAALRGIAGLEMTGSSCLPIFDILQITKDRVFEVCQSYRRAVDTYLRGLRKPTVVVLAARWSIYYETDQFMRPNDPRWYVVAHENQRTDKATTQRLIEASLASTVDKLLSEGHAVVLVDQVPEFGSKQLDCFLATITTTDARPPCGPDAQTIRERLGPASRMLARVTEQVPEDWKSRVALLEPAPRMCNTDRCSLDIAGTYLYRDDDHLNPTGARIIVEKLRLMDTVARLLGIIRQSAHP
ncbi:MAG: acyltransferase family protein [Hyphomicrobiaceae bacterium]